MALLDYFSRTIVIEKQKQIAALENEITLQQGIFVQAAQNWLASIADWERNYLVYAPESGILSLNAFYQTGRQMQIGEVLGNIQPFYTGYFIEAVLSQYNFGKLAPGQHALLRFLAYPSEEFGTVNGQLETIKPIPSDSGYLAKVELPNGLITHLGKKLTYREGLQATVDIVTDNRTMLQRLLAGLRKAVER